ncbi:hypothetical protein M3J07_002220 [Ascochyta lentis]
MRRINAQGSITCTHAQLASNRISHLSFDSHHTIAWLNDPEIASSVRCSRHDIIWLFRTNCATFIHPSSLTCSSFTCSPLTILIIRR